MKAHVGDNHDRFCATHCHGGCEPCDWAHDPPLDPGLNVGGLEGMAEEYTRLRHNVETEQWLAEGHRDYAAATTDITAVLDLLRDAVAALRANVDGALHISKLTGKRVCMSCYEAEAECKCSLALARTLRLRAEKAGVPHGDSQ